MNSGAGSVWLFHTTHNAGTSLLRLFKAHGYVWNPDSRHHNQTSQGGGKAGCFIEEKDLVQPKSLFYDDVCGERGMNVPIGEFDKKFSRNSDKLLTIYPIRHPLHRNMAGDRMGGWEQYPDGCFTDNYGLRKLLGIGFDVHIEKHHIEAAKARAASFDIVMDMTNFTKGIETLCSHLDWSCKNNGPVVDQAHQDRLSHFRSEHRDIYNRWVERNAPEMEFYEFAKELSQRRLADLSKVKEEKTLLANYPGMPSEPIGLTYLEEQTQWLCPFQK